MIKRGFSTRDISHIPKMAAKLLLPDDDDFIDMEITSFSTFLLSPTPLPSSSPNRNSEFEFQMSSSSSSSSSNFQHSDEASSTSPADELFYKGKLLPLLLPPRLQMVHHLLQNEDDDHTLPVSFGSDASESFPRLKDSIMNQIQKDHKDYGFDEFYGTPMITAYSTPTTVSPFESCNASPSESFRVSGMLNPEDQHDSVDIAEKNQKKKRKQQKHYSSSSLGSKLRAWFGKASCKYELAYVTKKVADEGSVSKARESLNKQNAKVGKKLYPFGQIHRSDRFQYSFSRTTDLRSIDDTDRASSFSELPNRCYGCQELEIGNLIMGAIAHCKQSQQQYFD